jgi:hypothetical protein
MHACRSNWDNKIVGDEADDYPIMVPWNGEEGDGRMERFDREIAGVADPMMLCSSKLSIYVLPDFTLDFPFDA